MLGHLSRQLVARGLYASTGARAVATSAMVAAQESVQSSKDKYLEAFNKAMAGTMLNPPHFPADFIDKPAVEEGKTADLPKKLSLNFFLPHASFFQKAEVDLVLIPAVTGDFGVMPGHVPTVAQLRPGVISVHKELDKDVEKYFVSSGFAFVHNDSTADVCAVEAVKLDDLDPEVRVIGTISHPQHAIHNQAVRAGLQEYTAKLASIQSSGDDYEIAAAQIGVEVFSAMNSALGL